MYHIVMPLVILLLFVFQMELRNCGKIKLFKLGSEASEFCVLYADDYKSHVRKFIQNMSLNQAVIGKYLMRAVYFLYIYFISDTDLYHIFLLCMM